ASRPPRWLSRASAVTPSWTTRWLAAAPGVATKPMPQAARCSGSCPGHEARGDMAEKGISLASVRAPRVGTLVPGYQNRPAYLVGCRQCGWPVIAVWKAALTPRIDRPAPRCELGGRRIDPRVGAAVEGHTG